MSEDASALPWTPQQWATLRGVIQEAARKSRVASTFLPIEGPVPKDETTVPANWLQIEEGNKQPGEADERLTTNSGRTLHLTTIACNIYLRSADVADPNLEVAKSMVRRAAEVLGRLEDAIIFNGLPEGEGSYPKHGDAAVVTPQIYTIHGGRDHTGLLEAPGKVPGEPTMSTEIEPAPEERPDDPTMVAAVVEAVQKLETRGHFGPFAVVLGNDLYRRAVAPAGIEAIAPVLRFVPFLGGGEVLRSSTIPAHQGVVVALGGQPVELVLACDMDVKLIQVTLEPRHVLRVYEKFVLRIKELDSVCRLTAADGGEIRVDVRRPRAKRKRA